jgi:hypothetical protein
MHQRRSLPTEWIASMSVPKILFSEGRAGRDLIDFGAMPSKKDKAAEQDYAIGDRVRVNLHTGRIVDATVKALTERTDGKGLQVDFGKDESALIHLWQVDR